MTYQLTSFEAQGEQEICSKCGFCVPSSWFAKFDLVDPNFSELICYKCTSLLLVPKLSRDSLKILPGSFLKEVVECYSTQAQATVLFVGQPPQATELAYNYIINSCHNIPDFRMRLYKENWPTILAASTYLDLIKTLISEYAFQGHKTVPSFQIFSEGLNRATQIKDRPPPVLFIPPPPSCPPPKFLQSKFAKLYSPSLNDLNLGSKGKTSADNSKGLSFRDDMGKQIQAARHRTLRVISETFTSCKQNLFRRFSQPS